MPTMAKSSANGSPYPSQTAASIQAKADHARDDADHLAADRYRARADVGTPDLATEAADA